MTSDLFPHRTPRRATPRLRSCAVGLAAALGTLLGSSAGAETTPYYIGVSQYLGQESNLYRLGDGQSLGNNPNISKSDTVSATSLVAGVDQSFGRQRVYGSGSLRANRYQRNDKLNGETYGLNLALDWSTLERLSGTLSMSANQTLAKFETNNLGGAPITKRNLENTEQVNAKFQLGVVTRYSAEAMLGYRLRNYSATEYERLEFTEKSGSLGARYRPSSLLNLGAALRLTQADYPRFGVDQQTGAVLGDRLDRQDIDFTADWQPSGSSQVYARLSPTRTRYDRNSVSNFSGLTGSATWGWQATGKLRLTSTLSHDTGQSSEAVNLGIQGNGVVDYGRISDALQVKAAYDYSAKFGLTGALSYSHRSLVNTLVPANAATSAATGNDNSTTLALGARWTPYRSTQVGCDLSTEQRKSSNSKISLPMSASTFGCYGQFTLQL